MYKPRKETVAQPKKAVVELSDNDFYITIYNTSLLKITFAFN